MRKVTMRVIAAGVVTIAMALPALDAASSHVAGHLWRATPAGSTWR